MTHFYITELTSAEIEAVDGGASADRMDRVYNGAAGATFGAAVGFLVAGPAGAIVIGAAYGLWGASLNIP
mgnify:CR=1 FL=1